MLNIEHLLENAVCELEKHEVHEAYRQFMESPCNIELAENAGIRLDDVWVMAVYCATTLRQDWKEKWEDEDLVHCGECKWWQSGKCTNMNGAYDNTIFNPAWFCAGGERKQK